MNQKKRYPLPVVREPMIPMAFATGKKPGHANGTILAGDIGGTKSNLALFKIKDGQLFIQRERSYSTKEYSSLFDMLHMFQNSVKGNIDGICLGVAGPVTQGKVHGTNFTWEMDSEEITRQFHTCSVSLINDMEANAYGLAALVKKDLENIKYGHGIPGNAAILSPGTGLGEAGLYWDGVEYHPFATEGGHCDMSPRTELDVELWDYFHQKYGHVSWERLLSGHGILDIYRFLRDREREPDWLREKFAVGDPAAVITDCAIGGKDRTCIQTLGMFVRYLAMESAQLALKLKATGGIYLGGGILPKIIKGIDKTAFCNNFIQSGRMNSLLQMIPVYLVLNERTALLGAAFLGAMALERN